MALGLAAPAGHTAPAKGTFQPDGIPARQFSVSSKEGGNPRQYFLAIYSGSTQGTYYYIASAICETLRARYAEHRIHCAPFRSQGVSSNRSLMSAGRAQMAIVQADTNYMAATGQAPIDGARSVVSLHDEMGVLVVSKKSDIHQPADLRGHRVNLGPKNSAAHALWSDYLESLGIAESALKNATYFPQDISYEGLCNNYIDAFGMWIGHPVGALENALERCNARLIGMWHPGIDKLLAKREFYSPSELPAGVYKGQDTPLKSYAIKASLIAHEKTDPYIVYWVTKVLIENVDFLRARHPALARMAPREMYAVGNFLPSHEGAARYWQEIGWDNENPAPTENMPATPAH